MTTEKRNFVLIQLLFLLALITFGVLPLCLPNARGITQPVFNALAVLNFASLLYFARKRHRPNPSTPLLTPLDSQESSHS